MGVWNLLRFDSKAKYQEDVQLNPSTLGPAISSVEPDLNVFQFGQGSPYYWVMVTTYGLQRLVDNNVAAQVGFGFEFGDTKVTLYVNTNFIIDPNGIVVAGFFGPGLPGPATNIRPSDAIPQTTPWQLLRPQSNPANTLSNTIHELWYVFGFPTANWANSNIAGISVRVAGAGGSITPANIYADTSQNSITAQPGLWYIARVPTVMLNIGSPFYDPNLVTNSFLRFIYDATANVVLYNMFNTLRHIQIVDISGAIILDGLPINFFGPAPHLPPVSGILNNPLPYFAAGVFFDGQTGLSTVPELSPVAGNTARVSFAGWFNADFSGVGTSSPLEFSQGDALNNQKLFVDATDNTTILSNTWFHLMGSIDASKSQAALLVNGKPTGTTGSSNIPFSFVPAAGFPIVFGTDFTNFFTGNIADLSIWLDLSWLVGGAIPQSIIDLFIDSRNGGIPADPLTAMSAMPLNTGQFGATPDAFLHGPALGITQPFVSGTALLEYRSGKLDDSQSSPSQTLPA